MPVLKKENYKASGLSSYSERTSEYDYDDRGNLISIEETEKTLLMPYYNCKRETNYVYDSIDRITRETVKENDV